MLNFIGLTNAFRNGRRKGTRYLPLGRKSRSGGGEHMEIYMVACGGTPQKALFLSSMLRHGRDLFMEPWG